MHISLSIRHPHQAAQWTTPRVWEVDDFNIELILIREISYEELDVFEDIAVVWCSEDMQVIFNPTIITEHEIKFGDAILQAIRTLDAIDFDVVLSTPWMVIDPCLSLLAEWCSLLKVMCRALWIAMIPLLLVLLMLIEQASCFAILNTLRIFHSNLLCISLWLVSIRGTSQVKLQRVYMFFVGSIFRQW